MRRQLLDALHKAGSKLKGWDTAYANKIYELTGGDAVMNNGSLVSQQGMLGRAMPISEIDKYYHTSQYEALGGFGPRQLNAHRVGKLADAGYMAANLASRYALPLGGLTLGAVGLQKATAGLYDLASNTPVFPQDQTNPPPM